MTGADRQRGWAVIHRSWYNTGRHKVMQIQADPKNFERNGEIRWWYTQVFNQHIITERYLEGTLGWSSGPVPCVMEEFNYTKPLLLRWRPSSHYVRQRSFLAACCAPHVVETKAPQRGGVQLWEKTVKKGTIWAPWLRLRSNFRRSIFSG